MSKLRQATKEDFKKGDVVIFICDEYRDGNPTEYDGHVQIVDDEGIHVLYLSGYKSRDDFIPYKDVLAKVDKRRKWIKLTNCCYKGNFLEFQGNKQ